MFEKLMNSPDLHLHNSGTFRANKNEPIHGWFNYTEGFSFDLVRNILNLHPKAQMIVDPFTGSSTTGVESVLANKLFHGYDINPVMVIIGEGKCAHSFRLARKLQSGTIKISTIDEIIKYVVGNNNYSNSISNIFGGKNYYSRSNLKSIFKMRSNIEDIEDQDIKRVLLLSLLSICVDVSNLKRSPDLKYKPEELWDTKRAPVEFINKSKQLITDLAEIKLPKLGKAKIFSGTAKALSNTLDKEADLIVTSPPYLNGTNYCRNTKLELWISGLLKSDDGLKEIRTKSISCSINSAQKRNFEMTEWRQINKTINRIMETAYDPRITPMVANYFHDMAQSIQSMYRVLQKGGTAYSVMGDSAFNGVHVPTHEHLDIIARSVGFRKTSIHHLRDRRSRGGMLLSEVIQVFEK